jgi:hypothetical protein
MNAVIRVVMPQFSRSPKPGEEPQPPSAQDCIALGVRRNGRALFLVPLSQFKSGLAQNVAAVT